MLEGRNIMTNMPINFIASRKIHTTGTTAIHIDQSELLDFWTLLSSIPKTLTETGAVSVLS
jgi:hypothetical protein